jgi:hypothetical protein
VRKTEHNTKKKICQKAHDLAQLPIDSSRKNIEAEHQLKDGLHTLLEEEDLKWRQRAKENWLKHGDRNTKLFHACANQRNQHNLITQIMDGQGHSCSSWVDIEQAFIPYFQDLFTSSRPQNIELCTQAIQSSVTPVMNQRLVAEITKALHQMAPLKAPGPDGFTADCYQQNWDVIQDEVCGAILFFLNSGQLDAQINSTNVAFIPKVKTLANVSDFPPISRCNILYKIVAKVSANRLKECLPHIISPQQSAFIPSTLITDNFLAAYEILHSMHTRMWSKVGFMRIKLDMSKAYDRVKWAFLDAAIRKMGFSER